MVIWALCCHSCDLRSLRSGVVSDHERQAIESRPCPDCASYTLACTEPKERVAVSRRSMPAERTSRTFA